MPKPNIFIVHLRQPVSSKDQREDPYWEVGSFGCTGCKEKTLLNPNPKRNRIDILNGSRFAFAQGGAKGTRLVFLTPPVKVKQREINGKPRLEVRWKPWKRPFRYEKAPFLVDKSGETDFPRLKPYFGNVNRSTWAGKFGSRFRSCVEPLLGDGDDAKEIEKKFDKRFRAAKPYMIARSYLDAITDLEAWKKEIKKTKCWEKKDRKKAYNEMCARGIRKPRRCGKRGC